jgi:U3 small nucleolar RNA-associated protein 21
MSFKTQNPIINLSFSIDGEPLLAAGDCEGFVWIWNLNDRKLISDKKHFPYPVSLLSFLPSSSLLIGCSSTSTLTLLTIDSSSLHSLREIRKRQGLLGSVQKLRFAGNLDSLVVVGADGEGEEGCMREVCIFNENASLNYSVKENKEVEKKGWKTEGEGRISQIINLDIAKVETDWANILTAHRFSAKPCFWSRNNRSIIKKSAELVPPSSLPPLPSSQTTISHPPSSSSSSQHQALLDGLAYITAVSVSGCGNFGSLGYSNGYISQINLQSGLFQKNFSFHKQEIVGLSSDSYNKVMISGDTDGWLVFFDFFSGEVLKGVKLDGSTVCLHIGANGSLVAIALSNYDIEIWHISMRNRARKLQGHHAAITEIKFSSCNRFLFSSSLDKTIKVWDILSGNIITNLLLPKAIQTFDISSDGELLASSFYSSPEICLWHCRTSTQPYGSSKEIPLRFSSFFQSNKATIVKDQKEEITNENEKITTINKKDVTEDVITQKIDDSEEGITFTGRKEGAWLPLLYWEELKERNRAEITEKKEVKVPFFLDFADKNAKVREQAEGEKFEEEKSRLLTKDREKNLEAMGSGFEKVLIGEIGKEEAEKMLHALNDMTPAGVEYEFRRVALGKLENIGKMLRVFELWFEDKKEIDLKNVYLASFLKVDCN